MEKKSSGFSLMEMLVSIVIGMIIVAAASTMLVNILKSQKDIAASASLNQELGTAMAVVSNEIRRAGFSVCDPVANDCNNDGVIDSNDVEKPFVDYAIGEGIKISGGGDCIEYRYNADLNNDPNTLAEHRGFRLNNVTNTIQMGDTTQNFACADPANSTKWTDLTDPDVFEITALNFSSAGSKCRNMTKFDPDTIAEYWVVKDPAGGVQTGLACDNGTTPVDDCTVIEDPLDPLKTVTNCSSGVANVVGTSPVDITSGDLLFGVRQINITLSANLTRDSAVSKILSTSVMVENPWVGTAP